MINFVFLSFRTKERNYNPTALEHMVSISFAKIAILDGIRIIPIIFWPIRRFISPQAMESL